MSLPIKNPPQLINEYIFSDHVFNYYRIRIISNTQNSQQYLLLSDLTELLKINFDCVLIEQLKDSTRFESLLVFDESMLAVIDIGGELKNVIHLSVVHLVLKISKNAIVPRFKQWLSAEILPKYQKPCANFLPIEKLYAADLSELNNPAATNSVAQFFAVYEILINQYDLIVNHAPLNCTDIIAINLANIYILAKTYNLLMPSKEELLKSFDDFFINNKAFTYRLVSQNATVKSPIWYKPVNCFLFQLADYDLMPKD